MKINHRKSKEPAVLYLRSSASIPQKSDGRNPLTAQERHGYDYSRRNGLRIVKVWADSGPAGRKKRIAFDQLIKYVRSHDEIKHIICDEFCRLMRGDLDKLKIWKLINGYGKTIHSARSNTLHNRNSDVDFEFMLDIEVAITKRMSKEMSRRIRAGIRRKALGGQTPMGYKADPKSGEFMLDPKKARRVRRMIKSLGSKK